MEPLTFAAVDDVAFAAETGQLDASLVRGLYVPKTLSPLLELFMLVKSGAIPCETEDLLHERNGATALFRALDNEQESWVSRDGRHGILRTGPPQTVAGTEGFLLAAKSAATHISRVPGSAPAHLIAAMEEMRSNILDHSEAESTGVVAFRAAKGVFEFVAADLGIGVLRSLTKCSDYASLTNHGEALNLALHEGTSRHGASSNHGYGFRDLFRSVVYLQADLRFRSGDYALIMDGTNSDLATARLSQKPMYKGFFVGAQCRLTR